MAYTAGDVMNLSAALNNDRFKRLFSDEVQLPFLKMANDDLDIELIDNGIPEQKVICEVTVLKNTENVTLPCAFFLPIALEQRISTSTDDDAFIPITEKIIEPSMSATANIQYWTFRNNKIYITPSTEDKTVRVEFYRSLTTIADSSTVEEVNKAQNYLAFRTAALCSEFIGGNKARADSQNMQAIIYRETLISALIKNGQANRVRRKPFRRFASNRRFISR